MPHYACAACRTRQRLPAALTQADPPICRQCQAPLDRINDLKQLIGLQAYSPDGDQEPDARTDDPNSVVVAGLHEFITRERVDDTLIEGLEVSNR